MEPRSLVRCWSIWSLLAAISLSGAAAAQQEPARAQVASSEVLQETVVTGSRLMRTDAITAAPVLAIGREQLDASAAPSIGEFLQQLPQQGGALNSKVNAVGDGQTQMNLRNLG